MTTKKQNVFIWFLIVGFALSSTLIFFQSFNSIFHKQDIGSRYVYDKDRDVIIDTSYACRQDIPYGTRNEK